MPTNPSGAGSFFGGLSTGIFDNLHKQKVEQLEADKRKKSETLKYLTSMLDQTTPDTRPVLMRHIADTMGLKGKHRGVWDMLTGKGEQGYSEALDAKLGEVMGNVVGPTEYEGLKPQAQIDMTQLPSGGGPAWASPAVGMTADRTAGKIALEDPSRTRLEQIRAQYGLQKQIGLEKLEEQQRLIGERQALDREDRQAHAVTMAETAAYNKAHGEVYKRAAAIAQASGKQWNDPQVMSQAAQDIATLNGLNVDKMRAQIGLAQANTAKATAEAAAAGSIDPATGLPTMDPLAGMKPGERMRYDQAQQQAAQGVYNRWLAAKSTVDKTYPQIQQLRASIAAAAKQMNADFDETSGTLINRGTGQPVNPYLLQGNQLDRKISQLRTLTAQAAQAETEVKGQAETLRSQYGPYYNVGADHWTVTPNAQFGGVGQAGAPRTMPPIPEWKVPTVGTVPQAGNQVQATEYQSASPLPVGTIIDTKRGTFKVTGLGRKGPNGYIHKIEPVKE